MKICLFEDVNMSLNRILGLLSNVLLLGNFRIAHELNNLSKRRVLYR